MTEFDGRRRQYVPLDARIAFGRFGSRLVAEYGLEGLAVWMLFLAACKREPVQGTFTFTSEEEAWTKLGAVASGFTLDAFLTFCGKQKKTRRSRHGRITYVVCTSWETWNTRRGHPPDTSNRPPTDPSDTSHTPPTHRSHTSNTQKETDNTPPASRQNTSTEPQNADELRRNTAKIEKNARPEVELEVEVDLEGEGEEPLTGFKHIVTTWLENAPPLIDHRPSILNSTKARRAATKAIDSYGLPDVTTAIANYAAVVGSDLHYFNHRWTLPDFLTRGLARFVPEAGPLENFQTRHSNTRDRGMTFEEILALGGETDGQRALGIGRQP